MKTSAIDFAVIAICIAMIASILILSGPTLEFYSFSTEVPFEVIDPGGGYNYEARANFTIRNASTWESLWLELYSGHSPIPEVPSVNFSSDMLIAVFQGERRSGGYLTNITSIIRTNMYCTVYVYERHPGEGCGGAAVMTYPYQIVMIRVLPLNLPMRFVYNITIHDCG